MGFFDFLNDTTRYGGRSAHIRRLERRREFIVEPYADELKDARVLDLASHDGRWSYALAGAGAREVVGIEARQDLIDQFADYPTGPIKDKVSFIQGDVFEELPKLVANGERFDVVAIYGLYYHIMDHYTLLKLVKQVGARLVVIDSEFLTREAPLIRLSLENTGSQLNTISHETGQTKAPIGIVSRHAMEMMAGSLGFAVVWADWNTLPAAERGGLAEYFREDHWKLRCTCALRLQD
jgi:hypothetical protein